MQSVFLEQTQGISTRSGNSAASHCQFILPTYPTQVAAVQMDDTGTTRIGRFVFNHPFFIPGTIGVALAVCFGFLIGGLVLPAKAMHSTA